MSSFIRVVYSSKCIDRDSNSAFITRRASRYMSSVATWVMIRARSSYGTRNTRRLMVRKRLIFRSSGKSAVQRQTM